jgi:hypothetical protein
MAIPVVDFQPLSFEQANPFLSGVKAIQQLFQGGVQNAYLPGMLEQQLKAQQLANAIAGVQAKYADPMTKAELSYKELMPDHLKRQIEELGLKNQYYPRVTESEIASRLAGASLANVQAKYYPEDIKSQIDLRRSQVPLNAAEAAMKQFQVQNPLLSQSGTAGQVGAMLYLQQNPELSGQSAPTDFSSQLGNAIKGQSQIPLKPSAMNQGGVGAMAPQGNSSNFSDLLRESIFSDFKRKKALTDYMNVRTQGYAWNNMPIENKRLQLAQAKALGYSYNEASKHFNEGYDISELAQARGIDPNNMPLPEFPPTTPVITQYERSKVALSALDTIEPIISKAVAPYARRFRGYSFDQIVDAVKGENVDKQAKYLAAAALQPEIAALRIKAAQGNLGITAINEMIAASQNNIKNLQATLSPDVYTKMNEYVQEWLRDMNQAERKALTHYQNEEETAFEKVSGSAKDEVGDADILAALGEQ